jgi:hypothetical protein
VIYSWHVSYTTTGFKIKTNLWIEKNEDENLLEGMEKSTRA